MYIFFSLFFQFVSDSSAWTRYYSEAPPWNNLEDSGELGVSLTILKVWQASGLHGI